MRKALLILAASGLMAASSPARSDTVDSTAKWEETYVRAGKRYEHINLVVLGSGIYAGVFGSVSAGISHSADDYDDLFLAVGVGASAGFVFASVYVTTPLGIAATLRQSKAVRALNPDAPFPWSGATAWTLFTGSLTAQSYAIHFLGKQDDGGFNNDRLGIGAFAVGTALLIGANVAARAQQSQNSTYWSQRMTTTADKAGSQRSPFSVTTAPLATHEVQGLMLYGTF